MRYTNGNYEAFAKVPDTFKPAKDTAHIIGGGLAGLSTAVFLIRDGKLDGKNITIYEEMSIPGGACDGINDPDRGFIIRGGREIEAHYECL
jgi:oleate hydratase